MPQGQFCRINQVYIIVPITQDRKKIQKSIADMMDKVSFDYTLPEIEPLAEESVE